MKIEKPCTENFSRMTKNDLGRHCSMCNTTVVDFTMMSAVEIKEHLSKSTGEVCGRFKSLQMEQKNSFERLIFNLQNYFSGLRLKPIRLTLLALLSGITVFMNSCMGKAIYRDDRQPQKDQQSTKTNQQDSIKHN